MDTSNYCSQQAGRRYIAPDGGIEEQVTLITKAQCRIKRVVPLPDICFSNGICFKAVEHDGIRDHHIGTRLGSAAISIELHASANINGSIKATELLFHGHQHIG